MKRAGSPARVAVRTLPIAGDGAHHDGATPLHRSPGPMNDANPTSRSVDGRLVDEKWRAYPDTILEFEATPPLRIDLRQRLTGEARAALAALGLGGAFGVFTAENPAGENAEDEPTSHAERARERANQRREGKLERDLRERGVPYVRVDGVSPDGRYREHCVATLMSREDAVAFARRFGQLAIFWYDGWAFWLLPVLAEKTVQRLPANRPAG
jgi:hypothetical protein